MTINKEQGLLKPSQCCRGTFYLKQAFALSAFRISISLLFYKMTSARQGKKPVHQDWYQHGQEIHHHIHSRKPKLSSEAEQEFLTTEKAKGRNRTTRAVQQRLCPPGSQKNLVLRQRALEQETPELWLHTWHDQSDPVTDVRPWSCTYRASCASQT